MQITAKLFVLHVGIFCLCIDCFWTKLSAGLPFSPQALHKILARGTQEDTPSQRTTRMVRQPLFEQYAAEHVKAGNCFPLTKALRLGTGFNLKSHSHLTWGKENHRLAEDSYKEKKTSLNPTGSVVGVLVITQVPRNDCTMLLPLLQLWSWYFIHA